MTYEKKDNMNTNAKISVSEGPDKKNIEKSLVFKWGWLVALNVIVPWLLAIAIDFDSISDTIAILLGILCIVVALVKIDHAWEIRGKTENRQALLTGATIKVGVQFFFISDIFIGVICILISTPIIDIIRPIGILLATLLVGAANFGLCFVGGLIVVSIKRRLPITIRQQLREDIISLTNQIKKEEEQTQLTTGHPLQHHCHLDKHVTFLLTRFHDHDWQRRWQIIRVLQRALAVRPSMLSSSIEIQVIEAFLSVLENTEENPRVRVEVAAALRNTKEIMHIKSFLPLLSESDELLRHNAVAALQRRCPLVYVVVFGDNASSENPAWDHKHTLHNPDVSRLTVPMRKLKTIVIHAESCDLRLVEAFARYVATHIGENRLKRQVTVYIHDEERQVPLGFWSSFSICKHVEVYIANIEVVVFGTSTNPCYAFQNTLYNPDVVTLTLPMSHLKQVNIHPETSDLRRLEEFCTYAINHIGQNYLKRYVDVHIYGDQKRLHPNLQNVFTNLCKSVSVHDRDEQHYNELRI